MRITTRPEYAFVLLCLSLPLLLSPVVARAADLLVPEDHDTIQEAIDNAEDGDLVLVDPGFYVENLNFTGKVIEVRATDGPEETIINGIDLTLGDELSAVVHFVNDEGEDVILDGFNLVDGPGGGVLCIEASPCIRNCIIEKNNGPGVRLADSSPRIEDCEILDNDTFLGAGIDADELSSPHVVGCRFADNAAIAATVLLYGPYDFCVVDPVVFENCTFENNSGGILGGVVVALSDVVFKGCEFISNDATFGGVLVLTCEAQIENCWFEDNVGLIGAAILHAPEGVSDGTLVIENTVFWNNRASGRGGVYYNTGSTDVTFDRCTIVDSVALDAGSVLAFDSRFGTETDVTMSNCILWDNGDSAFDEADSTITVEYSDVEGGHDGTGNIDEDPDFADPYLGDFSLNSGSPCEDKGDPDARDDPDGTRADMGASIGTYGVDGLPWEEPPEPVFGYKRGDADGNGVTVPIADAVFLLRWQFMGGDEPPCQDAADVDDNGSMSGHMDAAFLVYWGFNGGQTPPDPGPYRCGLDKTDDPMACDPLPECL